MGKRGCGVGKSSTTSDASGDICPAGWQMPSGGSGGDYETLYNSYGNYAGFVAALHTPLSGYFYNGQPSYQGAQAGSYRNGLFWSRTRYASNNAYMCNLLVNGLSSMVNPTNNGYRYNGLSVRCVLQ